MIQHYPSMIMMMNNLSIDLSLQISTQTSHRIIHQQLLWLSSNSILSLICLNNLDTSESSKSLMSYFIVNLFITVLICIYHRSSIGFIWMTLLTITVMSSLFPPINYLPYYSALLANGESYLGFNDNWNAFSAMISAILESYP